VGRRSVKSSPLHTNPHSPARAPPLAPEASLLPSPSSPSARCW
jgi:hypothetical protein